MRGDDEKGRGGDARGLTVTARSPSTSSSRARIETDSSPIRHRFRRRRVPVSLASARETSMNFFRIDPPVVAPRARRRAVTTGRIESNRMHSSFGPMEPNRSFDAFDSSPHTRARDRRDVPRGDSTERGNSFRASRLETSRATSRARRRETSRDASWEGIQTARVPRLRAPTAS